MLIWQGYKKIPGKKKIKLFHLSTEIYKLSKIQKKKNASGRPLQSPTHLEVEEGSIHVPQCPIAFSIPVSSGVPSPALGGLCSTEAAYSHYCLCDAFESLQD